MAKQIKNIIFVVLSLWQLYGWFEFVPVEGVDLYFSFAKFYYFMWFFSVAIIGILLSFFALKNKQKDISKFFVWALLVISICTAVPPIFRLVRYVFYPLAILLG